MSGIKQFYHSVDLVKVGELLNTRMHNITTAARTTLGGTMNATNRGLMVYDTDLLALFVWTGAAWANVSSTVAGAMTFTGAVAFNATEPTTPATGDYYVFTTAGSNTWEGTTVV